MDRVRGSRRSRRDHDRYSNDLLAYVWGRHPWVAADRSGPAGQVLLGEGDEAASAVWREQEAAAEAGWREEEEEGFVDKTQDREAAAAAAEEERVVMKVWLSGVVVGREGVEADVQGASSGQVSVCGRVEFYH